MGVPWSHVIPLAAALSFANGFWIVSLRGAVGAMERTSDPFAAWVRESIILVPWYALALLVALALSLKWFGQRPRGLAGNSGSITLLVAAGTLAGTLVLFASTIIDYRLQADHLAHMAQTHGGCDSVCLSDRVDASLGLGIKAVLVGAALIAVTSLVVVLLTVALRGGTILAGRPAVEPTIRGRDQRVALAASLFGAAAIHAAVIPDHLNAWAAAGAFFVVLAIAQVAAAVGVLSRHPRLARLSLYAAIALSIGSLTLWLVSRTIGIAVRTRRVAARTGGPRRRHVLHPRVRRDRARDSAFCWSVEPAPGHAIRAA